MEKIIDRITRDFDTYTNSHKAVATEELVTMQSVFFAAGMIDNDLQSIRTYSLM